MDFGAIFSILPKLIYFILSCVLSVIDLCQIAFRKIAGLEPIFISNEVYTGDSVYKIIIDALFNDKYPAVKTIFWAIIILAVFMLFITTFIMVLRVEYNPDDKAGNSKTGIIKNFFKAIFSFAIVPVTCLFGMYLANGFVGIIDRATSTSLTVEAEVQKYFTKWSPSGDSPVMNEELLNSRDSSYIAFEVFGINIPTQSEPFSGLIFRACAYGSNRMRVQDGYFTQVTKMADEGGKTTNFGIFDKMNDNKTAAELLDTAFAINANLGKPYNLLDSGDVIKGYYNGSIWQEVMGSLNNVTNFSKYNASLVFYFYDLWSFNYIIAIVAVMVLGKLYYSFLLTLMGRMFEIFGLFLVSPITVSLMPMDGGKALGSWRGQFVSKFLQTMVLVGTLNLVTPLINIAYNISLFGLPAMDYIIRVFFLIAALNTVKVLSDAFSKMFGADTSSQGEDIMNNFTGGLKNTVQVAKTAALPLALAGHAIAGGAKAGFSRIGSNISQKWAEGKENRHKKEREADNNLFRNGLSDQRKLKDNEKQERGEISSALNKYNNADDETINTDFESMSSKYDGDFDNFLKSDEGKMFGDMDVQGSTDWTIGQKRAYLNYYNQRENFLRTDVGGELAEKQDTLEFNARFDQYRNMREDEKVAMHQASSRSLTSNQVAIKEQIKKYQESIDKQVAEHNDIEEKKYARKQVAKQKGKETWKKASGTIANTAKSLNGLLPFNKHVNDTTKAIKGDKK